MIGDLRWMDKTRYELLLLCERKFWWKHGRGFTQTAISTELANGLAHHDAMDVLWRLVKWQRVKPLDAVEPAVTAWTKRWASEPDGTKAPDGSLVLPRKETSSYNTKVARAALTHYAKTFNERFDAYELLDIESSYKIRLGPIEVRGRWDKPLRHLETGLIWIGEHKSTRKANAEGKIESAWEQKWERDPGTTLYYLAGDRIFGDEFGGVLVDGALYLPHSDALSVPQVRNQLALKNFEESFLQRYGGIQRGEFPMRESQCHAFGRDCEYAPLCDAGWGLFDAPLLDGMQISFWNPEHK